MGYWHPSLSAGKELYGLALLFGYTERHNDTDSQRLRLTTRLVLGCSTPNPRVRDHLIPQVPDIPARV